MQFAVWIYWIYVYIKYNISKKRFFKQIIKFFIIEIALQMVSIFVQKYIVSITILNFFFSTAIFYFVGRFMIKDIDSMFGKQEKNE